MCYCFLAGKFAVTTKHAKLDQGFNYRTEFFLPNIFFINAIDS